MSLNVVENACTFTGDRSRGVVVIESDAPGPPFTESFHELDSTDARNLALQFSAGCGLAPPRINGNVIGPYPINGEGLSLEHVKDGQGQPLPPQHPRMQVARYRIDVPVAAALR